MREDTARVGFIPDNVTLIGRKPYKVELPEELQTEPGEKLSVVEVYISDSTNAKTLESGRKWAEGYSHRGTSDKKPVEISRPNLPMTGIRILSLEHRGQGGRAYKVILPNSAHYVDFREDVLVDTILNTGISPGGLLNGDFVFARVGSEMKLVRVGSKLHAKLIADTEARKAPVITVVGLIPGHAYKTKGGLICVYLGQADAETTTFQLGTGRHGHEGGVLPLFAATSESRNAQVWLDYDGGNGRTSKGYNDNRTVDKAVTAAYVAKNSDHVKLVTSERSVIEDLGPTRLGLDPITEVREEGLDILDKQLKNPALCEEVKNLRQNVAGGYYSRYNYNYSGGRNPKGRTVLPDAEKAIVWYENMKLCTLRATGSTIQMPQVFNEVKAPPIVAKKPTQSRYSYSSPLGEVTAAMQMMPSVLTDDI